MTYVALPVINADIPEGQVNEQHDTESIAALCASRNDVQPYAKIVGHWVWVVFPSKPEESTRSFLKQTGFRWNKERNAWQHPCGFFSRKSRGYDPREKYGEIDVSQRLLA